MDNKIKAVILFGVYQGFDDKFFYILEDGSYSENYETVTDCVEALDSYFGFN